MNLHLHKLKVLYESNTYYTFFLIMSIILFAITIIFQLSDKFYALYKFNYTNINTAMFSFFGVLLAFILTILAILFSLRDDSLFLKLIEKHERNKKDVLNYFNLSILLTSLVLSIFLFLTVTYVPLESLESVTDASLKNFLAGTIGINNFLIHSLIYFIELAIISLILLLATFLRLIRD